MLRTLASRWLAPLILVGFAAAQQIQVPSGPLEVGKPIEFKVSDPSRANGSIVVTIDNGDPVNPDKVEVEVKLDASGNGSASWSVADWWSATFNAPGCKEVSCSVVGQNSEDASNAFSGQRVANLSRRAR